MPGARMRAVAERNGDIRSRSRRSFFLSIHLTTSEVSGAEEARAEGQRRFPVDRLATFNTV
jgi:hypothetical protein